mmetsp:Transcript_7005/g.14912  ORF Transcript_7005/g.14912 Transcript_7005/m.14912 type:complete len:201 (-) Transcript_7005:302-904(-)
MPPNEQGIVFPEVAMVLVVVSVIVAVVMFLVMVVVVVIMIIAIVFDTASAGTCAGTSATSRAFFIVVACSYQRMVVKMHVDVLFKNQKETKGEARDEWSQGKKFAQRARTEIFDAIRQLVHQTGRQQDARRHQISGTEQVLIDVDYFEGCYGAQKRNQERGDCDDRFVFHVIVVRVVQHRKEIKKKRSPFFFCFCVAIGN